MSAECRIGCLAWWAGLWWLGLAWCCHVAAWGVFYSRDLATSICYRFAAAEGWCAARAQDCAREGGAE